MSFPYGLVQAGQNLCFFVGQCHLDNTLLPGLVNIGSPHFLFRETGRASTRNPVGGDPAVWEMQQVLSKPGILCSCALRRGALHCCWRGFLRALQWGAVGVQGLEVDNPRGILVIPLLVLHHVSSQKLSFLTCKMGVKVASTPG